MRFIKIIVAKQREEIENLQTRINNCVKGSCKVKSRPTMARFIYDSDSDMYNDIIILSSSFRNLN